MIQNGLTDGEYRVLADYVETGSTAETARRLEIAPQTVKNLLYRARKRTGARNTAQLVYLLAVGDLDADK